MRWFVYTGKNTVFTKAALLMLGRLCTYGISTSTKICKKTRIKNFVDFYWQGKYKNKICSNLHLSWKLIPDWILAI